MAAATLEQMLAASTSLFKEDAPSLVAELLGPPPAGSLAYRRQAALANHVKKRTIGMTDHPTDPWADLLKAIGDVAGGDRKDTLATLADRTNPHDPVLAAYNAVMLVRSSIVTVDARRVLEDPGTPLREFLREHIWAEPLPKTEAVYERLGYRIDIAAYKAGFEALTPLADSLSSVDIRQTLIHRCRLLIFSIAKDFHPLLYAAEAEAVLDIVLDRAKPNLFMYRFVPHIG